MIHAGEHVVQAVAELVKQGLDLVMGEQHWLAVHRGREIAGHVGDRDLGAFAGDHARLAGVHPGAAALVGACIQVEIELAAHRAVGIADLVELDVGVPDIHAVHLVEAHSVEPADHFKHAGDHPVLGEPGLDLLLGDGIARLAQLFAVVGDVPGLEIVTALFGGKVAQFGQLTLGLRTRARGQVVQKTHHLVGAACHLGGQRAFGVVGETQQLRQFVTQRQDLLHEGTVVVRRVVWAAVGGAGVVGLVEGAPQVAVVGVAHHRVVGGEVEGEHPALLAAFARGLCGQGARRLGQTGELLLVGDVLFPGVGAVEHVLGEAAGQLRQALADLAIARLLVGWQVDTREMEIAQRILQHLALCRIQWLVRLGQALVGLVQARVLALFGAVL